MKLRKYVGISEETPSWYSPAWFCHSRQKEVYYPVGLHWIARWLHGWWCWFDYVPLGRWDLALHAAHAAGLRQGLGQSQAEIEQYHELLKRRYDIGFAAGREAWAVELLMQSQEDSESHILASVVLCAAEIEETPEGEA